MKVENDSFKHIPYIHQFTRRLVKFCMYFSDAWKQAREIWCMQSSKQFHQQKKKSYIQKGKYIKTFTKPTWIGNSRTRRTFYDAEGFFQNRWKRKGYFDTAILQFAVHCHWSSRRRHCSLTSHEYLMREKEIFTGKRDHNKSKATNNIKSAVSLLRRRRQTRSL